ncbi:hypothetical protein O0L34_g17246 [Tuta absoluta]|nr:hypothetical protein O0L34_g17246 [Tuta absoluta]
MRLVAVVFTCLTGLAVTLADQNSLNDVLFSGDYEFIDLTHPFDNKTVYWTNTQNFEFTKKTEEFTKDGWYAAKEFAAGEHGGTHLDAPYHFTASGLNVANLPLEKLIVPLIIVDVSSITNVNPSFVLYNQHLDHILNNNLGKPCVVIFKFGWSKYFNDRKKYLGLDDAQHKNFPGLSAEIAEWVTTHYKNIVGIGVDTASVDPGSSQDFPVHRITAASGLYGIENVNLNKPIPDHGCTALVMPMKIAEGSGAPLRLVAICPKQIPKRF